VHRFLRGRGDDRIVAPALFASPVLQEPAHEASHVLRESQVPIRPPRRTVGVERRGQSVGRELLGTSRVAREVEREPNGVGVRPSPQSLLLDVRRGRHVKKLRGELQSRTEPE
jgi:hypothetical protein